MRTSRWATAALLVIAACSSGVSDDTVPSSSTAVSTSTAPTTTPTDSTTTSTALGSTTTREVEPQPTGSGWTPVGPGGGGAFAIPGAAAGGLVMVPSDLSGIYRSTDHGRSWDALGPVDGLTSTHATVVSVDSQDHTRWLLGVEGGLQLSLDTGLTWQTVIDGGYLTDAVLHGTRGWATRHDVYDSVDGTILRSDDGGVGWEPTAPLPEPARLLAVRTDPHDPDHVMVLAGEGRFAATDRAVFASGDAGATWRRVNAPSPARDIVADPNLVGRWWATTYPAGEGELYVSDDWGDSWSHVTDRTGVLWLSPELPDVVRLIDIGEQRSGNPTSGTWRSDDAGATWHRMGEVETWTPGYDESFWGYGGSFDGDVRTIGFTAGDPDEAWWSNSQFVYRTSDGGASWHQVVGVHEANNWWSSTGIDNTVPLVISASPADPDLIIAGFLDLGCQRSIDGGVRWQGCNPAWATGNWQGWGGNMGALVHDPDRLGVVWIALAGDLDRSPMLLLRSDEGAEVDSLVESRTGLPEHTVHITDLALDPASPTEERSLFAAVDGDVYRSVDDGWNWSLAHDCGGCRVLLVHDGRVWAGGEAGLFISDDMGDSWNPLGDEAWTGDIVGPWWEWTWHGVADITPDTAHPGEVWVAVTGVGLSHISTDGAIVLVLADPLVRTVATSPGDPGDLWIGSSSATFAGGLESESAGVQHSSDRGTTWTSRNDGLPWPFAIRLESDQAGGRLWVVNPGRGIHHRPA